MAQPERSVSTKVGVRACPEGTERAEATPERARATPPEADRAAA